MFELEELIVWGDLHELRGGDRLAPWLGSMPEGYLAALPLTYASADGGNLSASIDNGAPSLGDAEFMAGSDIDSEIGGDGFRQGERCGSGGMYVRIRGNRSVG